MNNSLKLLMLICFSFTPCLSVMTFEQMLYQRICDPQIIQHPKVYEATELFNHLYRKINAMENLNLNEVKDNFNQHYEQM